MGDALMFTAVKAPRLLADLFRAHIMPRFYILPKDAHDADFLAFSLQKRRASDDALCRKLLLLRHAQCTESGYWRPLAISPFLFGTGR